MTTSVSTTAVIRLTPMADAPQPVVVLSPMVDGLVEFCGVEAGVDDDAGFVVVGGDTVVVAARNKRVISVI